MIRFRYGNPIGGALVSGRVDEWEWPRRGGNYKNGRDFFTIHWEMRVNKPNEVRFHVESPDFNENPRLNNLKVDIVSRFLKDDIREAIYLADFEYKAGRRISENCIRKYKSTEPFRVILPKHFLLPSAEENIEKIHNIFRKIIHVAIEPYLTKIQEEFYEPEK